VEDVQLKMHCLIRNSSLYPARAVTVQECEFGFGGGAGGLDSFESPILVNDTIYYAYDQYESEHTWCLAKINADGSGNEVIEEFPRLEEGIFSQQRISDIQVIGDWIYFHNSHDALYYRMHLDGSGLEKVM